MDLQAANGRSGSGRVAAVLAYLFRIPPVACPSQKGLAMVRRTGMKRERRRRLHQRFLDAADRYPTLSHTALTAGVPTDWFYIDEPLIRPFGEFPGPRQYPAKRDFQRYLRQRHRLANELWWRVLEDHRDDHEPYPFGTVHQLFVDDLLWVGRFVDPEWTLIDMSERRKAVQQFERLCGEAALGIDNPPVKLPRNARGEALADWWLSCVYVALSIKPVAFHFGVDTLPIRFGPRDNTPVPVLRLPCDVFTASARAVEALGKLPNQRFDSAKRAHMDVSFTPKQLRNKLDNMGDDRLRHYAKAAGVVRPQVGQREHRYDRNDVLKICRSIIASNATERFKNAAAKLLKALGDRPAI